MFSKFYIHFVIANTIALLGPPPSPSGGFRRRPRRREQTHDGSRIAKRSAREIQTGAERGSGGVGRGTTAAAAATEAAAAAASTASAAAEASFHDGPAGAAAAAGSHVPCGLGGKED